MMGEPKAFASLSAGLLARKGGARPAMRRQPLVAMGGGSAALQEDLGWNDMGYDVDPDLQAPMQSVDLKPLLAGSVMNVVDDASQGDLRGEQPVPAVMRQRVMLEERLAEAGRGDAPVAVSASTPISAAMQELPDAETVTAKAPRRHVKKNSAAGAAKAKAKEGKGNEKDRASSTLRAREKAAFTLRLDPERHLRLRLLSAVTNRSSQRILTELLDEYLASLPEIGDLASKLPAVGPSRIAGK